MLTSRTTATNKLLKLRKRIRAISGGTGASKTYSIVMILIAYAQAVDPKEPEVIDIISESYPHLEAGVMQDFKQIMKDRKYWEVDNWNATKHIYTFETGSTIKFMSVDKIGKAHGPRRDVLFLNECNYMNYDIVDQLITRTRKIVWLDWNPSSEFWYYTEMEGKRKDIDFIKLTYLDNEALSQPEVDEIEGHKHNLNWWKVYGLGELGEIEGRIYTNWKFIDDIPHEARLERYGLDFGYDPDPASLVAIYYYNGGYILDELLYATKLDNPTLASTIRNLPPALTIADSAEPKSIQEIRNFGINIVGAEKGPESVRYGVKTVQAQKISITKRSLNLIKEYRNYLQAFDRKTNQPLFGKYEGVDHALDATRYAICTLIPVLQRKQRLAQYPFIPRTTDKKTNIAL